MSDLLQTFITKMASYPKKLIATNLNAVAQTLVSNVMNTEIPYVATIKNPLFLYNNSDSDMSITININVQTIDGIIIISQMKISDLGVSNETINAQNQVFFEGGSGVGADNSSITKFSNNVTYNLKPQDVISFVVNGSDSKPSSNIATITLVAQDKLQNVQWSCPGCACPDNDIVVGFVIFILIMIIVYLVLKQKKFI